MDKSKRVKTKKKTKDILAKLDRQFGKAVQTIEKKKNQPDGSHGVPLPKSTFVKENEKGMESIPIRQQNMEPIQQSKSLSPIPTPSLLNSVNFRGRVVSFNEECKLRAIPLPLQREVYKQTPNVSGTDMISAIINLYGTNQKFTNSTLVEYGKMAFTVRNTKERRASSARKKKPRYSSTRCEYLNCKERNQLLSISFPKDIKYNDYLFMHEQWLSYSKMLLSEAKSSGYSVLLSIPKEGSILKGF